MRVRLLGPVDVVDAAGTTITIGSPTQRLLLAVLGSRVGDAVPQARLVDAVWGECPPPTAEATLRSYVSRLRRVLGDAVATCPGGWSLRLAPEQVDIVVFERLLRLSHEVPEAAEQLVLLEDALALWRGPAFGELTDNPTLRPAAVRLAEARAAARESRAALLPRRPVLSAPSGFSAPSPFSAPSAFPAPSARSAPSSVSAKGSPTLLGRSRHGRPPAAALLGRAADLAAVSDLIGSARIVTLFGPGGVGKTRLALHLADSIAGQFTHGVRLVELAGVRDPAAVAATVADEFGVGCFGGSGGSGGSVGSGAGGMDGEAMAVLAGATGLEALLILDGCEHVGGPAAAVASALVSGGPGVRVLATSREPLGLDGEHCWPVRPLRVDGPDAPALALFRARATPDGPASAPAELAPAEPVPAGAASAGAASAGVVADSAAAGDAAVERIVRRLDGLPLGIEMAAARSGAMPLAELADSLDEHLDFRRGTRRASTARHGTLTDVVAWSVSMLDRPHRAMLRIMGAFAGPVVAMDVAALAGLPQATGPDMLDALVARSLVVADPAHSPTRYSLLETIRDYARRELGAADDTLSAAHARYVLGQLRVADGLLRTPREAQGQRRLADLLIESRAARAWALANDPPLAVEIAAAVHVYAMSRLRIEPLSAAVELIRAFGLHPPAGVEPHRLADLVSDLSVALPPGVSAGALSIALATAAAWYVSAGDLEMAGACAQRGRLVAGDAPERRFSLELLGDLAFYRGRIGEAVDHGWELVAAARSCGDRHAEVAGLRNVMLAHAHAGNLEAGRVVRTQTPPGPLAPSDIGWLAYGEAELVVGRDPDRCLLLLDRAVSLADSVDNCYLGGVARFSALSVRARRSHPRPRP
ncbi:BTAD domain-containing putative transcriptional regulator [Parafrankia sp. EUN1f]|uniref:BTAD domain-containing putative transcriptional regulator n=1 Tax=Parafrankia sp. EUN1f TaxID=102897 RepID=UPI001E4B49AD|nr:BTAD domain-containing putative transcriptional regulator [Parafrankia sp. EUN1f]